MTLAILCSGQGRQHSEMFALTGDAPEAVDLFDHAADLLGCDARDLVRGRSAHVLHGNRTGQILCTLQAMASAATLQDIVHDRIIVAGYSIGEVAAWGVGGIFDPTDTLDLAARRAEAMDKVSEPGDGLIFVRGLSRQEIDLLCVRHGAAVAIVNPGCAYVVGGGRGVLSAVAAGAAAMGATRIADLPVEVASHTKRLAPATAAFRETLRRTSVRSQVRPGTRILSGIDGAAVVGIATGLDKLAAQISQTVEWASCLQSCIEAGATTFLELGPGHALSGMVQGAWPDMPTHSLDEFRSLAGVRSWLSRHVGR